MGTIPTVPTFPAGYVAQGAQLAELCTAISWLMSGKPLTRLTQGTAQSFTSGTAAAVTWDTKIVDRDSGWSSSHTTRYTAQTPGYYQLAAGVSFASNTTGARLAYFQVTTGSNNPAGPGVTTAFCRPSVPGAGLTTGVTLESLTPYLYDLDYVEVYAEQNSGGALSTAVTGTTPSFFTISLASG